MESDKPAKRRRYDAELKRQILAECDKPGASVARVAMANGVNTNVVHRWRQLAREDGSLVARPVGEFVPVAVATSVAPTVIGDIRIELRRGATTIQVVWPGQAVTEFAAWMRELLR